MTITAVPSWPVARPGAWTRLAATAERKVARFGDDLTEAQNAIARAHGIRVTRMSWGGRRYTHLGFAAVGTIEGESS
ncbi:MAG: hypothetical protein ACRCYX_12510 [Dermatophilaceae bacterium]